MVIGLSSCADESSKKILIKPQPMKMMVSVQQEINKGVNYVYKEVQQPKEYNKKDQSNE
jgi:hypothetical protein